VAEDAKGKMQTRAYSIASAPTATAFELCVNRVEEGFFSNHLADLPDLPARLEDSDSRAARALPAERAHYRFDPDRHRHGHRAHARLYAVAVSSQTVRTAAEARRSGWSTAPATRRDIYYRD
jgi:hypothetical protein